MNWIDKKVGRDEKDSYGSDLGVFSSSRQLYDERVCCVRIKVVCINIITALPLILVQLP